MHDTDKKAASISFFSALKVKQDFCSVYIKWKLIIYTYIPALVRGNPFNGFTSDVKMSKSPGKWDHETKFVKDWNAAWSSCTTPFFGGTTGVNHFIIISIQMNFCLNIFTWIIYKDRKQNRPQNGSLGDTFCYLKRFRFGPLHRCTENDLWNNSETISQPWDWNQ